VSRSADFACFGGNLDCGGTETVACHPIPSLGGVHDQVHQNLLDLPEFPAPRPRLECVTSLTRKRCRYILDPGGHSRRSSTAIMDMALAGGHEAYLQRFRVKLVTQFETLGRGLR